MPNRRIRSVLFWHAGPRYSTLGIFRSATVPVPSQHRFCFKQLSAPFALQTDLTTIQAMVTVAVTRTANVIRVVLAGGGMPVLQREPGTGFTGTVTGFSESVLDRSQAPESRVRPASVSQVQVGCQTDSVHLRTVQASYMRQYYSWRLQLAKPFLPRPLV